MNRNLLTANKLCLLQILKLLTANTQLLKSVIDSFLYTVLKCSNTYPEQRKNMSHSNNISTLFPKNNKR